MKHLEDAVVVQNREIRPGIWSMWVHAPAICHDARPGQFVHVKLTGPGAPLLRRPLSIGRVHGDELELVWRVVGKGTDLLGKVEPGSSLNLFGPLGNPFRIAQDAEHHLLVGGGLGLPPLVYLYDFLTVHGYNATLLLGVRGKADIPLADDDTILQSITVTAENGEGFRKGLVTEPALEQLEQWRESPGLNRVSLYSCGPWGLVGALQKTMPLRELGHAQVSLEQQMGCANGVCQGCAVTVDGGSTPYQLVCHDGPVFSLCDVHPPVAG